MTNNEPDYNDNLYFESKAKGTLTEQWKRGELPEGWYWVDYYSVDGAVMLEYIPQHNGFGYEEKELVQAVLAPVPTFDEWKASYNCMLENEVLRLKNAQLKELLTECRNSLEEQSNVRKLYESDVEYRDRYNKKMDLLIKLDEVLNA